MTAPTQIPKRLVIGDTWEWTRDLSDYPASVWTATWHFENASAGFSVTATADGDTHVVEEASSALNGIAAGRFWWRLSLTRISDSARQTPDDEKGWVDVEANPASATNVDHRTAARATLDAIEAYLRDPNNLTAASYTINGRALARWSITDLLAARSKLLAEVRREEGSPRRLYARFDRA